MDTKPTNKAVSEKLQKTAVLEKPAVKRVKIKLAMSILAAVAANM